VANGVKCCSLGLSCKKHLVIMSLLKWKRNKSKNFKHCLHQREICALWHFHGFLSSRENQIQVIASFIITWILFWNIFGGVVYLRISYVKYPNNLIQTSRYLQAIFRYGSEKVIFSFYKRCITAIREISVWSFNACSNLKFM